MGAFRNWEGFKKWKSDLSFQKSKSKEMKKSTDLRTIEECDEMMKHPALKRTMTTAKILAVIAGAMLICSLPFIAMETSPINIPKHNDSLAPSNTLQENIRTTSPQADSCIRAIKMKRKK